MRRSEDPLRTLIVGDDPFARGGLGRALAGTPTLAVSGQLHPREVHALLSEIDAVLWDLGPSDPPLRLNASVPVLALAALPEQARRALGAGANGVLAREVEPERIDAALHALIHGMRVVDQRFSAAVFPKGTSRGPVEPLTPREQEVLEQLARGLSNAGIARVLDMSDHTAKFHVNAILAKLNARSRTDAVMRAVRMGLLQV